MGLHPPYWLLSCVALLPFTTPLLSPHRIVKCPLNLTVYFFGTLYSREVDIFRHNMKFCLFAALRKFFTKLLACEIKDVLTVQNPMILNKHTQTHIREMVQIKGARQLCAYPTAVDNDFYRRTC